jgi:DNA-directed RNA polymerase subunit K/omega
VTIYDSLHNIPMDILSEKVGGRHRLTRLISLRLRALNSGAPLLVEKKENEALLAAVCREVAEGKIWLEVPEEQIAPPQGDLDLLSMGETVDDTAAAAATDA